MHVNKKSFMSNFSSGKREREATGKIAGEHTPPVSQKVDLTRRRGSASNGSCRERDKVEKTKRKRGTPLNKA